MKRFLLAVSVLLLSAAILVAGPVQKAQPQEPVAAGPSHDPVDHWEVGFDTAALWSVGGGASPLQYVFLPQIITIKTHSIFNLPMCGGDLVLRNRVSFLAEPIVEGPESYFIGAAAGGSLEWWNAQRSFSVFLSSGGGVGWMDAQGYVVEGGQGQDFNLNWYIHSGLSCRFTENLSASLGLYFQHVSNGGQNDVNPGVNALGPTLGVAWHF